jgi:hypothetical protein
MSTCHSINILTYTGPDPRLRSVIEVVGGSGIGPWQLLARHARTLGRHRITRAEVANDLSVPSAETADATMRKVVQHLDKPWHQRGNVQLVHQPNVLQPAGCVDLPTIYYEARRSSVALKCYVRQHKLAQGKLGNLCVRLEWTLTGCRALSRHLGGNQLYNLLQVDLADFLKRNVRLVQVDYAALGKVIVGKQIGRRRQHHLSQAANMKAQWQDPDYRARRRIFLVLRWFAYRDQHKFGDWEQALWICQNSPAQIRGICRGWTRRTRRDHLRKYTPQHRQSATDYRFNACFHRL